MRRRAQALTLPTQAFLIVVCSVGIVSAFQMWHQGVSIKAQVLGERLIAISRQASIHKSHAAATGIGHDRAALTIYLQGEVDEMMLELGAIEVVVTDETGLVVASSEEADNGQMELAEEVHLILSGASEVVMRPEKGDEENDFSFAIPFDFPAFNGAFLVEEDIQALKAAMRAATWGSALPVGLVILIVAPIAALIGRRILKGTQLTEHELAWKDRFQSLVQNASDVILIVNRAGAIQYATPATARVLGRSPADLQDVPLADLIHPSDSGTAQSALSSTGEPGHVTRSEYRMRHADGHWLFADVHSANLLYDPSVRGTVLTIRDISERKALEAHSPTRHCTTRSRVSRTAHSLMTGCATRSLAHASMGVASRSSCSTWTNSSR